MMVNWKFVVALMAAPFVLAAFFTILYKFIYVFGVALGLPA